MSFLLLAGWIGLLVFIATRSVYDLELYLLLGWIGLLALGAVLLAMRFL